MPEFSVLDINLNGKKMVEASAGTGKTFSLAILFLRLVIEKEIPVKQVLMMTFTNAAVEELAERIRLFARLAMASIDGQDIGNPTITQMLAAYQDEEEKKRVRGLLHRAMLDLDQVQVMTIHSFCSKMLKEFAFETGQDFGSETIEDTREIIGPLVDDFWRKNVAVLSPALLEEMINNFSFNRSQVAGIVNQVLAGKQYTHYNPDASGDLNHFVTGNYDMLQFVEDNIEQIGCIIQGLDNGKPKPELLDMLARRDYQDIIDKIDENRGRVYAQKLHLITDEIDRKKADVHRIIQNIKSLAIKDICEKVKRHMSEHNLITFDDMIEKMRVAIQDGQNGHLLNQALRERYKAVFIDEFQDTDKAQYEIFRSAFMDDWDSHKTSVFLIGDPKQMIYAFRKADMATYFAAQDDIREEHRYQMDENFRSSKNLVEAMNVFFRGTETFDPFLLGERVRYIDVRYPGNSKTQGELSLEGDAPAELSIEIIVSQDKKQVKKWLMHQMQRLLGKDARVRIPNEQVQGGNRAVKPSDIGILVRTKNEAREIKRLLSNYGIPAIQVDDMKIFETDEANELLYVLSAFLERTPGNIRRASLTPFTKLTDQQITNIDIDAVTAIFKDCHDLFVGNGVFQALQKFMEEFRVQHYLLYESRSGGDRIYSNLIQLREALHQAATDSRFSPAEVVNWLRKMIGSAGDLSKEYEQRIESDENAVKIVTIHKAKGLEYNIVFAPFVEFKMPTKITHTSFRHDGQYLVAEVENLSGEHEISNKDQFDQENRRLMYVAVTRARYKCFLHHNSRGANNSVIATFIQKLEQSQPDQLAGKISILKPSEDENKGLRYPFKNSFPFFEQIAQSPIPRPYMGDPLPETWRKLSYSAIASHAAPKREATEPVEHGDRFERFVFNEFPKGAKAGNILHTILEKIDFTDHTGWEAVIGETLDFYRLNGDRDQAKAQLGVWLDHLLQVRVSVGGEDLQLSAVGRADLIPEFEFDFNLREFTVSRILEAAGEMNVKVNTGLGNVRGIMNGLMDLFFRHNGKYYILDWKSNHLGNTTAHYGADAVASAMADSNYHLQYLVYSVAARLFLRSRVPGFNYGTQFGGIIYLFARGVRQGAVTGIFTDKVDEGTLDRLERLLLAAPAA